MHENTQPIHQHFVRRTFLCAVSAVYLAAFTSLYVQIPGLFGDDGLMPVGAFLARHPEAAHPLMLAHERIGLRADEWLEAQSLLGILVAAVAVAGFATMPVMVLLWALYASCFSVGQTFLSFQWDILLLEVGAQAALLAPLLRPPRSTSAPVPSAVICLLRFTLFKLMLMSGVSAPTNCTRASCCLCFLSLPPAGRIYWPVLWQCDSIALFPAIDGRHD